MKAARKLMLGETWALPVAVALVVGAAAVLHVAAPVLWRHAGGPLLAAGVVVALAVAVARSPGGRRRPRG